MTTFKKIWNIVSTVLVVLIVLCAVFLMGSRLMGYECYNVISPSKAAHSGESFYVIRNSNAGANINVKNCEISVDAEQGFTGVAGAKGWGVFVNRIASYDINAEYVEITMTDAALAQSELKVATCLSTGKINMTNVTLNGIAQ